jgi:hypothetical protein
MPHLLPARSLSALPFRSQVLAVRSTLWPRYSQYYSTCLVNFVISIKPLFRFVVLLLADLLTNITENQPDFQHFYQHTIIATDEKVYAFGLDCLD